MNGAIQKSYLVYHFCRLSFAVLRVVFGLQRGRGTERRTPNDSEVW